MPLRRKTSCIGTLHDVRDGIHRENQSEMLSFLTPQTPQHVTREERREGGRVRGGGGREGEGEGERGRGGKGERE